jgi:hypothetical protein
LCVCKWLNRLLQKLLKREQRPALREFVYLDEVSVYSLYSSRLGAVPKEITDTRSSTLQSETSGTLGLGEMAGAGLVKSDLNSGVTATRGSARQVLRKSTIQSTFKKLYETERESLAICPDRESGSTLQLQDVQDFRKRLEALQDQRSVIDPTTLTRGCLLEVEARLEAEATFRVSTVLSAITEFVEDAPEILDPTGQLEEAKVYSRLVEKLLSGLVPIQGRAVNYEVVNLEGRAWLVHHEVLDSSAVFQRFDRQPLYIVGVAERSLFWKDIRRVLFSNARFRILCRVSADGLQEDWTAVKLVHVLESVEPRAADAIRNLGTTALSAMSDHRQETRPEREQARKLEDALHTYSDLVANKFSLQKPPESQKEIRSIAVQSVAAIANTKARRRVFEQVLQMFPEWESVELDPQVVAECREVALERAGLDFLENSFGSSEDVTELNNPHAPDSDEQQFLDTEIVAIYW